MSTKKPMMYLLVSTTLFWPRSLCDLKWCWNTFPASRALIRCHKANVTAWFIGFILTVLMSQYRSLVNNQFDLTRRIGALSELEHQCTSSNVFLNIYNFIWILINLIFEMLHTCIYSCLRLFKIWVKKLLKGISIGHVCKQIIICI